MFAQPNASHPSGRFEQRLDLGRVIRIARRHLRLMVILFVAVIALTSAMTMTQRPVYTASVQMMIDKPSQRLLSRDSDPGAPGERTLDDGAMDTEVQVLRSPALAESVMRDLRLACPCALCVEEMSGRALLDPASVPADVLPRKVTSVGTYAMIVDWSDGHGTGIYTYGYLRGLGGRLAATVSEDV